MNGMMNFVDPSLNNLLLISNFKLIIHFYLEPVPL